MKLTVRFHEHTIRSFQHIISSVGWPKSSIEIGCFEGDTTFNISNICYQQNPNYKHYAIDPFDTSDDLPEENISSTKKIFLENLEEFEPKGVVEFINKKSFYPFPVYEFNLPAGHSCPFAKDCKVSVDKETGKFNKIGTKFRCYAASSERFPAVRKSRWENSFWRAH
jgi:hypothetical protein